MNAMEKYQNDVSEFLEDAKQKVKPYDEATYMIILYAIALMSKNRMLETQNNVNKMNETKNVIKEIFNGTEK